MTVTRLQRRFIAFILWMILIAPAIPVTAHAETPRPVKILFIGSSYFNFNDLPGMFKGLAAASGKEVMVDQYIPLGWYLSTHAESSVTKEKINSEKWDYVVFQGVGRLVAYPEYSPDNDAFTALRTLKSWVLANNPKTTIVFSLPWAYEDGMTWLQGWTDGYPEMQRKIYSNTLEWSKQLGISVAPVGWAWYHILEEKDYPLHYLHQDDWNHPTLQGSYLSACVIFASIFTESPEGIEYYNKLETSEAESFQEEAGKLVLDDLTLWNLPVFSTVTNSILYEVDSGYSVCFPNPCEDRFNIEYNVVEEGDISISVYNQDGRLVFLNTQANVGPGRCMYSVDSSAYPAGIYYCEIRQQRYSERLKLLVMR